jgi:hypothetical protein
MPRVTGPRRSGPLASRVAGEIIGSLAVIALATVALRHVIATARQVILWYDGDSVLLPLVVRSIRLGEPFEWAMSPALFFFPELPVYLLCAAVTTTPQEALALNGVLVLCAVYVLVRVVAAQLMPTASSAWRITVSVLAMVLLTAEILTESSTDKGLELSSLLLTTTYYYGVVLAMLATAALALRVVRTMSLPEPRAGGGALVTAAAIAFCSTASNPLYVPWSAAPVIVTVALLAVLQRVPWRIVWLLGTTLVIGSGLGYLLREPLHSFVSLAPATYVHPSQALATLQFFAQLTDERAGSAAGDAGLLLMFLGVLVGVGGMVWAWRVRTARTVLVATTLSTVTVVAVSVGVIATGSDSPRYLEPVVTIPLVALVAVAELARTTIRRTRVAPTARGVRLVLALVTAAILAAGVAVVPSTVSAVRTARYGPVSCLDRWAGSRDVVGVGQFWTVRPLATYSSTSVRLLQVRDNFTAYPWLVDLASYSGARPTFVLVGSGDFWSTPVEDSLGSPRDIVHCSGYDIYDYAGTAGARTLRTTVVDSAEEIRTERGF